jgi:hypothetical protein
VKFLIKNIFGIFQFYFVPAQSFSEMWYTEYGTIDRRRGRQKRRKEEKERESMPAAGA